MDIIGHTVERRHAHLPCANNSILTPLESYWQTLRQVGGIPARNDIVPSKIDMALPHAFIAQRVAPGTARMRVAGQKLHELLKMDARGMPLTMFFHPQARDEIKDLLEIAFTHPAIISMPLLSQGGILSPTIKATMLLLPLRDRNGVSNRILGALVTDCDVVQRPRRFVIPSTAKIRYEKLGIQRVLTTLVPRNSHPIKRPNASHPALRLVVNNG